MDNWLLIIVGIIFLVCIIGGIARGAIRILVSLAATAVTLALVIFATPYVSDILYKMTPVKEMVQDECEKLLLENAKDQLTGAVAEKITALTGIDFGNIDMQAGDFDWEAYGVKEKDILAVLDKVEFPREVQIHIVENSGLPQFLRDKLLENNNNEVYQNLGVSNFVGYIGAYLAKLVTDILAFLITFMLATIIVRIAMYALNIIGALPVIHGLNRLAGGVLGMGTAVVIVWVLFIIMTLGYNTELGKAGFELMGKSPFLSFMYEHNYILQWITKFR